MHAKHICTDRSGTLVTSSGVVFAATPVAGEFCDEPFVLTDVGAGIGLVGDYLAAEYPDSTYRFVEPINFPVGELEARFGGDVTPPPTRHTRAADS